MNDKSDDEWFDVAWYVEYFDDGWTEAASSMFMVSKDTARRLWDFFKKNPCVWTTEEKREIDQGVSDPNLFWWLDLEGLERLGFEDLEIEFSGIVGMLRTLRKQFERCRCTIELEKSDA